MLQIIFTFSGIDVTVVDNNNRTVLDLLASHPSAKAREIRDLIFGEFYFYAKRLPCSTLFCSERFILF